MALINQFSSPSIRGQADLFGLPPTDTTIESSFYAEYKPVVNIQDNDAKIDFRIVGNTSHYLDLFDHFCLVTVKVVCDDGTDMPAGVDVSTANLFLHSLFSNCEVSINSTPVSSSNNCYMYKAFLENMLTFGRDYNNSQATCALFYEDTEEGVVSSKNNGYKIRSEFVSQSKSVQMIDKIRFDLAYQHRYIPNDTSMTISLTKNSNLFSLFYNKSTISTDPVINPKVKFVDASLFVRKHILYPSIVLSHQKLLENGNNALYPFKKSDVKFFSIPKSTQSFVEENVFLSSIPSRIVICLVPSNAFIGSYTLNPFVFKHFDISFMSLCVNNIPIPIKGMNLDFSGHDYVLPYYLMFCSLGMNNQNRGLAIDRNKFRKQYPFFVFDVFQESGSDSTLTLDKTGSVRVELQFKVPLPEAVNCLIYSEHQKVLEIDKFRQVKIH